MGTYMGDVRFIVRYSIYQVFFLFIVQFVFFNTKISDPFGFFSFRLEPGMGYRGDRMSWDFVNSTYFWELAAGGMDGRMGEGGVQQQQTVVPE